MSEADYENVNGRDVPRAAYEGAKAKADAGAPFNEVVAELEAGGMDDAMARMNTADAVMQRARYDGDMKAVAGSGGITEHPAAPATSAT